MWWRGIGNFLPKKQCQRRTCYALCHTLYPVSAAHASIFRMSSNSTSYVVERRDGRNNTSKGLLKCVALMHFSEKYPVREILSYFSISLLQSEGG